MKTSNYFTTKGIILNSSLVRESDRLVSILTEDMGRVRAVAPGAHKISARLLCATEPGVESTLTFYDNTRNTYVARITGGVILRTFPALKCGLERYLITSKILEIVDSLLPEREPNTRKYSLVLRTLELLEIAGNGRRIYLAFVLRFLKLCGWGLELGACIKCGAAGPPGALVFSLKEKGGLCPKCAGAPEDYGISGEAFLFLKKLAGKPGSEIEKISVAAETEKKTADAVESYLLEYIPRPLKSGMFV